MFSNYPAGVSDAHPYFNPPRESMVEVTCEGEESIVVPSYAVKAQIIALSQKVAYLQALPTSEALSKLSEIGLDLMKFREEVEELEDHGSYECPYKGEEELPEQADVEWTCPVCGEDRVTDNIPDDGPDPDEAYERMMEARRDD